MWQHVYVLNCNVKVPNQLLRSITDKAKQVYKHVFQLLLALSLQTFNTSIGHA